MIPYFIHSTCGGQLYLAVENIMVISTYGIGTTNLKIGMAQIIQKKDSTAPRFYCSNCGEMVISGITGFCSICRELIPVENLYRISGDDEIGGIFCLSCIEESDDLKNLTKKSLAVILQKPVNTGSIL